MNKTGYRWGPVRMKPEQRRNAWLLLYWPVYLLMFFSVERLSSASGYTDVACAWDHLIPFCEYFVIPYLLWFVAQAGMVIYTFLFDPDTFRKFMTFIMATYTVSIVIYLLFPTCQSLRPASFERDNLFTRLLALLYSADTSTNVCPSIHVLGALAVMFAGWHTKGMKTWGWRLFHGLLALSIILSTLFVKQHSVIDVLAALPISLAAYLICFHPKKSRMESAHSC